MKKGIITIILSIACLSIYAQTSTGSKKDVIENFDTTLIYLKEFAVCRCLRNGYSKDSPVQNDQSYWELCVIVDNSSFFTPLDSFINKFMVPFKKMYKFKESTIQPRIMLGCITMHNNKELDKFLRKYMLQHPAYFNWNFH